MLKNYRDVTLTNTFSIILDKRLRKWATENNVLNGYQFGFGKSRSTVDCIFILTSIIDNILKNERKKLYCSFIDFKKMF